MKFLYWTLCTRPSLPPERLAVIRETDEHVIALGEAGTRVRRERWRCGGRHATVEEAQIALERTLQVRSDFRAERERMSDAKAALRREERLATRTAMGAPP